MGQRQHEQQQRHEAKNGEHDAEDAQAKTGDGMVATEFCQNTEERQE